MYNYCSHLLSIDLLHRWWAGQLWQQHHFCPGTGRRSHSTGSWRLLQANWYYQGTEWFFFFFFFFCVQFLECGIFCLLLIQWEVCLFFINNFLFIFFFLLCTVTWMWHFWSLSKSMTDWPFFHKQLLITTLYSNLWFHFVLSGKQEDWPANDQHLLWQGHRPAKRRSYSVIWWPAFCQSCYWLVWWWDHWIFEIL